MKTIVIQKTTHENTLCITELEDDIYNFSLTVKARGVENQNNMDTKTRRLIALNAISAARSLRLEIERKLQMIESFERMADRIENNDFLCK